MAELQSLSTDVLKSSTDIDNYESEFNDLRSQLYEMTKSSFNGIALFGDWEKDASSALTIRTGNNVYPANSGHADSSVNVAISSDGQTTVQIHRSLLGSALMVDRVGAAGGALVAAPTSGLVRSDNNAQVLEDTGANDHYTAAAFSAALDNIASLRATNGGQASRLQYAQESVATQISNMEAALGRILDVDIAAETTNLAKQQILVQASASMVAQANSANQVALMLLQ